MKKKILSILLSVAMVVTMMPALPMTASEAYADTGYGISNPRFTGDNYENYASTWDCVYFGHYKQTKVSGYTDYFSTEPIKWRVLHVDGDDAFLVADKALDGGIPFNNEPGRVFWDKCTLRTWLNKEFMNTAFKPNEQRAIIETTNIIETDPDKGIYEDIVTEDDIFLLSDEEASNMSYGFYIDSSDHKHFINAENTDYAESKRIPDPDEQWENLTGYWLRTNVKSNTNCAKVVSKKYAFISSSFNVEKKCNTIRPALHLDLKSDVWSYAGTVSNDGTVNEIEPEGGWSKYRDIDSVSINLEDVKTDEDGTFSAEVPVLRGGNGDLANETGDQKAKDALKIFPGDFNMAFPLLNFKFMKTDNGDGTYTIHGHLGADYNKKDGFLSNYEKNKKKIKDFLASDPYLNNMEGNQFFDEDGKFKFKNEVSKDWYHEIDIFGYYEAKIDENGKVIYDEGGALINAEGGYTYDRSFMAGPVPCYIELAGMIDAYGTIGLKNLISSKESGDKVAPTGSFTIMPMIYAGAGVGVNGLASFGVRGYLKVPIGLVPAVDVSLTVEASLRYALLFIINGEIKIAKHTWNFYHKDYLKSKLANRLEKQDAFIPVEVEYEFADRDYQYKTTKWNGRRKLFTSNKLGSGEDSSITETPLQEFVMPDTIPQLNTVSDDKVMVFQVNDSKRTVANASVLKYSVLNNGSWSEPKAVKDDGKLDTYADSKVIGDNLYVAWQKCTSEIDDRVPEEAAKTAAEKSEIFVSKYDTLTNTFAKTWQITNNAYLDGMPKLVDCGGKPGVVWTRNTNNSVVNISGKKQIYSSTFDGTKWSDENKLSETEGTITELTGIYKDNKLTAYYTVSNSTGTIQDLCRSDAEVVSKILTTYDANTDSVSETMSGLNVYNNQLNYVQNGNIKTVADDDTISPVETVEENRISANSKRFKIDGKDAILWMSNDEHGCAFYSAVKDGDNYSSPVEIYRNEDYTGKMFDALLNDDGSWDIIYTGQSVSDAEKTSIFYVNKKNEKKVSLNAAVINELELTDEGQPIEYSVTNTGEQEVTELDLSVEIDSEEVLNKKVSCSIAPGETVVLDDKITETPRSGKAIVKAFATGQQDMSNSEIEMDVVYNNFAITNVIKDVSADAEYVTFTATIKNTGKETNSGKVSFYKDANATNLMETKDISDLLPGASTTVSFVYKTEDAVVNADEEDPACPCSIKVEAGTDDMDESDNMWSGITYLWEFYRTTIKEIKSENHIHNLVKTSAEAATCTEEGNIEYWTCEGCHKLFSDENGNSMIDDSNSDGVIDENDTVTPTIDHQLVHVFASEPTKEVDGSKECWYCSGCGEYFKTEAAENVVKEEDVVVNKIHEHKFEYTASGNAIIATCKTEDDSNCAYGENHSLTLTLTVPDAKELVYTGKAKKLNFASGENGAWYKAIGEYAPAIKYYLSNGTKTTPANSGSASEGAAPVYAGKYVAKVTAIDDYGQSVTIKKSFEITTTSTPVELLSAKASGKRAVKLSWTEVEGAKKYVVYGARCGKHYKKLKTLTGTTYKVKKIRKKLKAHRTYKFCVIAYTKSGKAIKSKTIHFITGNTMGKYANVKSINPTVNKLVMSVGKTKKLGAKYKMYKGKKHVRHSHGYPLRYISNNKKVVKVLKNNKIKAVGRGTATVYIQDIGGKFCKTEVTVK